MILGIDLTASEKKPAAYALLHPSGHQATLGFLRSDHDILALAAYSHPQVVAIDSPVGFPKGQCCLEESCSCASVWPFKGRVCERELAARGIGSFYTTKRSIIKAMVYRAIGLVKKLSRLQCQVLEVYPYAAKIYLFGRPIPSKMRPEGLAFLKDRIAHLIPGAQENTENLDHDLCDALVVAYTGYLHTLGQTETLGLPEEGTITVPKSLLPPLVETTTPR